MTQCNKCKVSKITKWYYLKNTHKPILCKKCYDNKRNKLVTKEKRKEYRRRQKIKALKKCGSLVCINCGQYDISVLEFNMIGGGHTKLVRDKILPHGETLQRDIIMDRIDCKLFDIRCKVCNMYEYVNRIYGLEYYIVPI